jgi:hypothetical protein
MLITNPPFVFRTAGILPALFCGVRLVLSEAEGWLATAFSSARLASPRFRLQAAGSSFLVSFLSRTVPRRQADCENEACAPLLGHNPPDLGF